MADSAQKVLDEALQLPEQDRERIADCLWRSTHGFTNAEIAREWKLATSRRLEDIAAGRGDRMPHDRVMEQMRAKPAVAHVVRRGP